MPAEKSYLSRNSSRRITVCREPSIYSRGDPEDPEIFIVEGPKIEKMLGYTNLDSEKGFAFFQRFLKEGGILEELEKPVLKKEIQSVCTDLTLIIINRKV